MKFIKIILLFLVHLETYGRNPIKQKSSISITKFYTKILKKDSVWDLNSNIKIPTQPKILIINIEDLSDFKEPNFICIFQEYVTTIDTLYLKNSKSLTLYSLTGGDYTLTFINLNNQNKTEIIFSIEPVFWQKWWFSILIFGVSALLLAIIFYFFYLIRLRQQLRLQSVRHELEIKALRAQMNPHFIFNSMNTIDAYILRKKFVEASDCLQKFSKLIRRILENSENQTISIGQEIETLKLYIELEQERFSHSFDYSVEIVRELLNNHYQIPPLLIQPFVENAILHGIRHLTTRKGLISVKFSIENEHLKCEIEDNGIGREASKTINLENERNHKSMGLDITLERISTHQAIYGNKMKTKVLDLEKGTLVTILLPLVSNEIQ